MNKKRITAAVIILIFAAALLSGCEVTKNQNDNSPEVIEISPGSDAARTEYVDATLYFADATLGFLVGESHHIEAPVNDRIEKFILKELINGPENSSGNFNALINPKTEIISISDSGDVLTIVLSSAFLSWPFDETAETADTQKMLAVYSIVNTLVEASGYPRIQILVDRDSSGAGQRLQVYEVGNAAKFTSGEAGLLGPLSREGSLVLTPSNTLSEIMRALTVKDFDSAYAHIAYNDTYGHKRPAQSEFFSYCQAAATLEGYSLSDEIVSDDGQTAVVMMNYTLRMNNGETLNRTVVPCAMLKENGVWKQKFSDFEKLFDISAEEES